MGTVTQLGFPEVVKHVGVRVSGLPDFSANAEQRVWDRRDPDVKQDVDWLNTNTPGWRTSVKARSFVQRELPIGAEASAAFLFHEVSVVFASAAHRQAWRQRVDQMRADAEALKLRVQQARENAPEGVQICTDCAGQMEPDILVETARVAQFAFALSRPCHRCHQCGSSQTTCTSEDEVIFEVMERARDFVGLPHPTHSSSTEETKAEWQRRKAAPPLVTILITQGMTADSGIALLQAAL